MRAIKILPGGEPVFCEIENELSALQAAVDGYIDTVTLGNGIVVLVNEEGKLLGLPVNGQLLYWPLHRDVLFGTVVFVRSDGDEFAPVWDGDMDWVRQFWLPVVTLRRTDGTKEVQG